MNESTAHTSTDPTDRYLPPGWFARNLMSRPMAWLARRGVSIAGTRELRVVGRTSGEVRTTVVNLLDTDGRRYLVAPRGNTQWVRNLRVAGRGELRVGRRIVPFEARELDDGEKGPILSVYLDRWGWEVGQFFDGVDQHASAEELAAIAPGFPVFELTA